ncbi:galactokinase [Arcicella aquatica]|uniref:Galactokinase n=1 Tax=Arcicella aquatica TaxID=217141 RepID=A0ABU5QVJ0_9BACT|nr:galactokinase [Arcicella aquatica]MEA5260834.1 galactokinase [Arcicella aquatica]
MYPENIIAKFQEQFSKQASLVVRAPGRINLIGEHTDYNDGFVLPAAIDKAIYFAIAPRQDDTCNVYAYDLESSDSFSISDIQKSTNSWANYLIGVVDEIQKAGQTIKGFDLVFGGDIPLGAGVSSSAAVETGLAFALNEIYVLGLATMQMVKIGKAAENNFVGVNCGIMDQFASMFGKKDAVIRLDCRSLDYQHFPLSLPNHTIILCNSGVKHSLGDSEYNTRRLECEEGLRILGGIYPAVKSFRDLTLTMVENAKDSLSENVYKRCVYVVGEIDRVVVACEALEQNDLATFGKKMYETHDGLQHNYAVSCEELDFLVDETREDSAVVGSRMMGGGFGGCTVNIVEKSNAAAFLQRIKRAYQSKYQKDLVTYEVALTNGTEAL